MNFITRIPLQTSPEQAQRLLALQERFAEVCNALSVVVQQTRIWNRVALHHLAYRKLRDQFPDFGSQMVCNAIYSVSRTSRLVFQSPDSPFSLNKLGNRPLPLMKFSGSCPVYFDRHTLSLKDGQLSLYTLDGRMRFNLSLRAEDELAFKEKKLREIVLSRRAQGLFELAFWLTDLNDANEPTEEPAPELNTKVPEYVFVEEVA